MTYIGAADNPDKLEYVCECGESFSIDGNLWWHQEFKCHNLISDDNNEATGTHTHLFNAEPSEEHTEPPRGLVEHVIRTPADPDDDMINEGGPVEPEEDEVMALDQSTPPIRKPDMWTVSTDHFAQVKEWHKAFGLPGSDVPNVHIGQPLHDLRWNLIEEELLELRFAQVESDLVEIADALADLLYVVYGAADVYGIPIHEVFNEVQRSNMSKLGADGKPILRSDGKIMKGENYSEPDIAPILRKAGWNG